MLDKFFKTIEKIAPQKWRRVLNHEGFRRYFANPTMIIAIFF